MNEIVIKSEDDDSMSKTGSSEGSVERSATTVGVPKMMMDAIEKMVDQKITIALKKTAAINATPVTKPEHSQVQAHRQVLQNA